MVAEFMEDTERMESELHAKAPEGLQLKHLYDAPEMLNGLIKTLKIIEKFDDNGNLRTYKVNGMHIWIFNRNVIGCCGEFDVFGQRICQWN